MHLADFSYTARFVQNACVLTLFAVYLGVSNGFEDLRSRSRRCQTKMAVFYLLVGSLLGWLVFDAMAMKLKYDEWRDPDADCMPKRHTLYSEANREALIGIKYFLNLVWTCHSSALFFLLVFLENLAKPYAISLATSYEYTAYRVWAPLSFIVYPLVQTLFDYVLTSVPSHTLLASVTPQLAVCCLESPRQ